MHAGALHAAVAPSHGPRLFGRAASTTACRRAFFGPSSMASSPLASALCPCAGRAERGSYSNPGQWKADLQLVVDNAKEYNVSSQHHGKWARAAQGRVLGCTARLLPNAHGGGVVATKALVPQAVCAHHHHHLLANSSPCVCGCVSAAPIRTSVPPIGHSATRVPRPPQSITLFVRSTPPHTCVCSAPGSHHA